MKNSSFESQSWGTVVLAILPGMWLIFQQRAHTEIVTSLGINLAITIELAITILIGLVLIILSLILHRALTIWCLPVFGMLLWKAWDLIEWHSRYLTSLGPKLFLILITIGIVVGILWALYCLYRDFKNTNHRVPRLVRGLICLCLLSFVTIIIFLLGVVYPSIFLTRVVQFVSLFAPPFLLITIPGLPFAKQYGLAASLLVVSCEPVFIDMILSSRPAIAHLMLRVFNQDLERAVFILTYMPHLVFMIIIPIGLLRSRSERAQQWWLLLPSLLILVGIILVQGFALDGTRLEYSEVEWIRAGISIIQLWLVLVITAVLYPSYHSIFAESG